MIKFSVSKSFPQATAIAFLESCNFHIVFHIILSLIYGFAGITEHVKSLVS